MNSIGATLIAGLRFAFLLGSKRQPPAGPAAFWIAAALSVATDFLLNLFLVNVPDSYYASGLTSSAFWIAQALLLAWYLTLRAHRPAWLWSVASWILIISIFIRALACPILASDPDFDETWPVFYQSDFVLALGIWMFLAALRVWRWLEPPWHRAHVAYFALLTAIGFALPHSYVTYRPGYVYGTYDEEGYDEPEIIEIEELFGEQDRRVDASLAALAAQRPGHVDIYLIGVAGDASEAVFGNEVRYVEKLFDQRFDTQGRSVMLINDLDPLENAPLATERNLRRTLAGVAKKIDLDEDIVFLFLTSHGSEDHQFAIELNNLALRQITPDLLAEAINSAGIRWRVTAISACYSGGYIDALTASTALVMTAARKDRTSFGCGAESKITYFGRAYFAEALNETSDFIAAFEIAKRHIAEREAAINETPSEPQIASSALISAKLADWRNQLKLGPPIAFEPDAKTTSAAKAAAH